MPTTVSLNPYESPQTPPGDSPSVATFMDDSAPIIFHGRLTVDDAFEAQRLAKTTWHKIQPWITWAFVLLTVLCLCGVSGYDLLTDDEAEVALAALIPLLLLGIGIALALYHPRLVRSRALRAWNDATGPYAHTSGQVTSDAIISASHNVTVIHQWSAFCGYRASDRVAILYQEFPKRLVIFARAKFDHDDAWMRFLDLVWHRLPQI